MPRVLVRDLTPETLDRLKRRARTHGRSLQSELKTLLEMAASSDMVETRVAAERLRKKLARRRHTDSSKSIAADRRR